MILNYCQQRLSTDDCQRCLWPTCSESDRFLPSFSSLNDIPRRGPPNQFTILKISFKTSSCRSRRSRKTRDLRFSCRCVPNDTLRFPTQIFRYPLRRVLSIRLLCLAKSVGFRLTQNPRMGFRKKKNASMRAFRSISTAKTPWYPMTSHVTSRR